MNGLQLTNGSPVISRGHEQIGVKPLKLQSAFTPVRKQIEICIYIFYPSVSSNTKNYACVSQSCLNKIKNQKSFDLKQCCKIRVGRWKTTTYHKHHHMDFCTLHRSKPVDHLDSRDPHSIQHGIQQEDFRSSSNLWRHQIYWDQKLKCTRFYWNWSVAHFS